jgi:hypothetical protein
MVFQNILLLFYTFIIILEIYNVYSGGVFSVITYGGGRSGTTIFAFLLQKHRDIKQKKQNIRNIRPPATENIIRFDVLDILDVIYGISVVVILSIIELL